jgi:HSP20 family protein
MWRRRSERKCLFLPAAGSFHDVLWKPAADIYRTPTGWLAKFDLAGIDPQEIQVSVQGRCLCVHGVRRDCLIEEGYHYHALEISYSPFERRLEFPEDLETSNIETEYQAGMLLVRIQRGRERP